MFFLKVDGVDFERYVALFGGCDWKFELLKRRFLGVEGRNP